MNDIQNKIYDLQEAFESFEELEKAEKQDLHNQAREILRQLPDDERQFTPILLEMIQ